MITVRVASGLTAFLLVAFLQPGCAGTEEGEAARPRAPEKRDEDPQTLKALAAVVADKRTTAFDRDHAVQAIGCLKNEDPVPYLLSLVESDDDHLPYLAACALLSRKDPRSVPVLKRYLDKAAEDGIDLPGKERAVFEAALEELGHLYEGP